MLNHRYCYFYVIEGTPGLYKIGRSVDPLKRLRQLQTGSAVRFQLVRAIRTLFAEEIERDLHRRYAKKRVRGEWFELDSMDLLYLHAIEGSGMTKGELAGLRTSGDPHLVGEPIPTYND